MNVFKDTYLPRRFFAGLLLGAFAFVMGYVFPALLPVAAVLVAGWLLVVVGEGVALYRLREGVEAALKRFLRETDAPLRDGKAARAEERAHSANSPS